MESIDHNCECNATGTCACQGCECTDEQKSDCGCGNWQQCAIETQDEEGE